MDVLGKTLKLNLKRQKQPQPQEPGLRVVLCQFLQPSTTFTNGGRLNLSKLDPTQPKDSNSPIPDWDSQNPVVWIKWYHNESYVIVSLCTWHHLSRLSDGFHSKGKAWQHTCEEKWWSQASDAIMSWCQSCGAIVERMVFMCHVRIHKLRSPAAMFSVQTHKDSHISWKRCCSLPLPLAPNTTKKSTHGAGNEVSITQYSTWLLNDNDNKKHDRPQASGWW